MAHHFVPVAYSSLRVEGNDTVGELRADAIDTYKPINAQELFACERIAIAQVMLLRCGMMDAGFHTSFMNECIRPGGLPHNLVQPEMGRDIEVAREQNRGLCLATGFDRLFRETDTFKLFIRYQQNCRHEYREAVEDMDRLLALPDRLSHGPFEIPEPVAGELMDPPPPLTYRSEEASDYDPTIAIETPVPQTIIPKRRKKASRANREALKAARYKEPQPRFGTYPKGDETPQPIRRYGSTPES